MWIKRPLQVLGGGFSCTEQHFVLLKTLSIYQATAARLREHLIFTFIFIQYSLPHSTDGPALRSIALITYANYLLASNASYVANNLWPIIKIDLDYVSANWNKTT